MIDEEDDMWHKIWKLYNRVEDGAQVAGETRTMPVPILIYINGRITIREVGDV